MKILVNRTLFENIANALKKIDFDQLPQFSRHEGLYVRDCIDMILKDNPLPEKWVVIETRPMAMKDTVAEGMTEKYFARVDPKILTVVDSETEGWIYRNKSIPENRWRHIDVVKVENDKNTCW